MSNMTAMERASLERAFQRFLDALDALPADRTRIIGFDSHELPGGPAAAKPFVFREQADCYTRELIGDINFFVMRLHRLEAWRRTLESYTDATGQVSMFGECAE